MSEINKRTISPRQTKPKASEPEAGVVSKIFEYYFDLGPERSLLDLSHKTGYDFDDLKQWNDAFGWDQKISDRNKDLDKSFESYYKNKSRDIRNRLVRQMENLLGEMESCSLGLPFHIKDVQDFRNLANAYESLVRANSLAMTRAVESTNSDAPTTWADLLVSASDKDVSH